MSASAPPTTAPYQPPPHGWRTFLLVWSTQSVSVFGTALTFFAVNIWLTQVQYPHASQKPQLAFALTAMSLAFAVPVVFIAPLAGAWADRHDRKRTMMAMDAANGVLSVLMALLLATHLMQLWLLVPLTTLYAVLGAFHGAAFDTSYAMIVPEERLPRANGMMQTIWSLSGILSPALAAGIISLPVLARHGLLPGALDTALAGMRDGTPLAVSVDAVTFFLACGALVFLYIPSPKRADVGTDGRVQHSIWADVRQGALYIWQRRPLLWLLGTFTVANFTLSPMQVFEPLLVKFNLAADWSARGLSFATALALLASAGAVGGVAGGFFISAWGGLKTRRVYGVLVPMIVGGAATLVFGLSSLLYLTAAMAFVEGAMTPILNAHSQSIWQTQTPRELQGRVFSVRRVIAQFSWPLSTALAGLATGLFNPGLVIAALGAVLVLFCAAQLVNPYLLRVEDKDWIEAIAASRAAGASGHDASDRDDAEMARTAR